MDRLRTLSFDELLNDSFMDNGKIYFDGSGLQEQDSGKAMFYLELSRVNRKKQGQVVEITRKYSEYANGIEGPVFNNISF